MRVIGADPTRIITPTTTATTTMDDVSTDANLALPDCCRRSDNKVPPVSKRSIAGTSTAKLKKAPDAPKRFKSAFIFFSTEKHKEIRTKLGDKGLAEKTTNVAKLVSEAWRDLSPEQREKWDALARRDKARYDVERATYKGPWKVPANKRTPKDPTAPKRPMSAFLAFSNSRRAMVKRQHPDATNAEISKTLSNMWKEAPEELKRQYVDEEFEKRQQYKSAMTAWRKKYDEDKRVERQMREEMALRAADEEEEEEEENSEQSRNNHSNHNNDADESSSYGAGRGASYRPASDANGYPSAAALHSQSRAAALAYGGGAPPHMYRAGMGMISPYFSSLGGYGSSFGPNGMQSMAGSIGDIGNVEPQLAVSYNPLGQLNSMLRSNYGPNAVSLNPLGQGLAIYPHLDGGNDALAYEYSLGQLQQDGGGAAAVSAHFGQYPFGGQGAFPPGWNFRG